MTRVEDRKQVSLKKEVRIVSSDAVIGLRARLLHLKRWVKIKPLHRKWFLTVCSMSSLCVSFNFFQKKPVLLSMGPQEAFQINPQPNQTGIF